MYNSKQSCTVSKPPQEMTEKITKAIAQDLINQNYKQDKVGYLQNGVF